MGIASYSVPSHISAAGRCLSMSAFCHKSAKSNMNNVLPFPLTGITKPVKESRRGWGRNGGSGRYFTLHGAALRGDSATAHPVSRQKGSCHGSLIAPMFALLGCEL